MRHSKYLRLSRAHGYAVADIVNPWDSAQLLQRYVLVDENYEEGSPLPEGVVVRVPLKNSVVYSTVYASAIKELERLPIIGGVVDASYFTMPEISRGIKNGSIADLGSAANPVLEKMIALQPDAIILNLYEGMDIKGIEKCGIPLIKFVDNMEPTPLARAEWIRFLGMLCGEEQKADSIFRSVEENYNAMATKVAGVKTRPKVLTDNMYEGVWYVPGGKSFQARLIADAGGSYPWAGDASAGSLNLSYEEVLDKAGDADIWLIKVFGRDLSAGALLADDPRYSHFKAINEGLWYSNTATNTLFDDLPFHPDRLLSDYIMIFHPELSVATDRLQYFKKCDD